jgi:autotransporter translocation and assembly factor TamB
VEDRTSFDEEAIEVVIDTTMWDWDITVELPGNYWIHNDQIDAEMSADLRLLRDKGRATYLGTAEIIRGKVYLFDKIGRIKRGVLTFDDTNDPDPRLDIDVEFRIRQPRLEGDQKNPDDIPLKLHVGGRASEPLIQLIQTEDNFTEQDVLLLLAANSRTGDDPSADRIKFAATGLLFSEVQRLAARKLGLETLEINSAGDATSTEITVGRYFSPHLYLYGSSPIDAAGRQEVGFEYRLNRRLFLEGNRDEENLYRLNLHLNWDY